MTGLYFKDGSVLDAEETVICHQVNCVSTEAAGLAKLLFEKYPEANIYKTRRYNLGSVIMSSIGEEKIVAHLVAQIYPGKPKKGMDCKEKRLEYFSKKFKNKNLMEKFI